MESCGSTGHMYLQEWQHLCTYIRAVFDVSSGASAGVSPHTCYSSLHQLPAPIYSSAVITFSERTHSSSNKVTVTMSVSPGGRLAWSWSDMTHWLQSKVTMTMSVSPGGKLAWSWPEKTTHDTLASELEVTVLWGAYRWVPCQRLVLKQVQMSCSKMGWIPADSKEE